MAGPFRWVGLKARPVARRRMCAAARRAARVDVAGVHRRGLEPDASEKRPARRGCREDQPERRGSARTAPQQPPGYQALDRTPDVDRSPVESLGEICHRGLALREVDQQEHVERGEARSIDRIEGVAEVAAGEDASHDSIVAHDSVLAHWEAGVR
jgi:hypothetical protein